MLNLSHTRNKSLGITSHRIITLKQKTKTLFFLLLNSLVLIKIKFYKNSQLSKEIVHLLIQGFHSKKILRKENTESERRITYGCLQY